jgi:hypothetical protein
MLQKVLTGRCNEPLRNETNQTFLALNDFKLKKIKTDQIEIVGQILMRTFKVTTPKM